MKQLLAEKLAEARERTRLLLATVSDEDLVAQHDPIMSPLIWDYGHIGNYEELWLLKEAAGKELSDRELYDMYDASLHPREERPSLNLLDRDAADVYLGPSGPSSPPRARPSACPPPSTTSAERSTSSVAVANTSAPPLLTVNPIRAAAGTGGRMPNTGQPGGRQVTSERPARCPGDEATADRRASGHH